MASIRIYPITIIPKFTRRSAKDDIQPLSTDPQAAWENVCNASDNVIAWGDVNPDAVDHNHPVSSSNFYNTITTYSGSFDTPTPFTTSGWSNNPIPDSAKIYKIDVEYAWDQVRYIKSNNCVTWRKKDCVGHYMSAGGYFKYPPQITLSIGGKNFSVSGPNVNSSNSCTRKNAYTYTESELKSCGVNIGGVNGLKGSDLKNAQVTFVPGKNYGSDVARIVMRHIRLYVEYEDVPPTFNLKDVSLSAKTITNCPNEKSTLSIKLDNDSETQGTTIVKISGAGIANANDNTINSSKSIAGNDTLTKENNYYLWTVKDNCKQRALSFDLSYGKNTKANDYDINVQILSNLGKGTTKKDMKISVKSCEPEFTFDILDANGEITKKRTYIDVDESQIYLRLKLHKNQIILDHNESLKINMGTTNVSLTSLSSWDNEWIITTNTGNENNVKVTKENNTYIFSNIAEYSDITIKKKITLNESGTYGITGQYINTTEPTWNKKPIEETLIVKGTFLGSDYLKLRLEDGSDVRYNSLMITKGDDLLKPLTYTTEEIDKYTSKMHIYGETKRIPVNEVQYVHFTIELDIEEDIELKNVLTYIEIYDSKNYGENILVGAGKGVSLLEMEDEYICSIDSISSNEPNNIKLAVKSTVEIEDVVIKIKPYNYDGYNDEDNWIPAHVMFKDIPNIKISIAGVSDIIYDELNPNDPNSCFWLHYNIQNLSDTTAKNIRFQLEEPYQFQIKDKQFNSENAWFNENNRIITFPTLEAHSAEKTLSVQYKATKRGIYDFVIRTLDNPNDLEDDQYENSYTHNVMVNIPNNVIITTDVSKNLPYVDELIDFHIKVKNLYKKQKNFKFNIYDIGSYDNQHADNDYRIEYVKCKKGTFTPMHGSTYKYPDSHTGNKIGEWTLQNIGVNDEYHLTLTLRPQKTGNHIFKTIFTDQFDNSKDFYNEVKVIEKNKQISFNVYHAVSEDEDAKCDNCDNLIEICDDDFINLGDNIFYVFEIKNNNRNPIKNALHVYARLPESFLTNKILCSSRNYFLNKTNNLISFTIPELPGCQHEDSTIKFCIKIQPAKTGKFVSNFSLSTRNAHVLHKKLHLTVDTEFNERKMEHEVNIYNFEKTNKYYRYEIDNVGNIFKFYNTGDKTLRPVETEEYKKSAIETYKGTNLRDIVAQIKDKSKYVDPVFLRIGNNKLADKGYELFPDGLIRRFGLLNSEVYHYTGQLPSVTNLVDRAMKWDIDDWDTKLWAGDIYDNGIFDLTVDYAKIPSNFNILDADYPIGNLQELVNNVKPYGTKAICHYSATVRANLQINLDTITTQIKHDINVNLTIPDDFTIVSAYNRYDNTVSVYYDLTKVKLHMEIENLINKIKDNNKEKNKISSKIDKIYTHVFADKISKSFITECNDLVRYIYSSGIKKKNIDITKPFTMPYKSEYNTSLSNIQILNFTNNIENEEEIGLIIRPYKNTQIYVYEDIDDINEEDSVIKCTFYKDDVNDFSGFRFVLNNNIIQERNIDKEINKISIQVQTCLEDNKNILHFWGSINEEEYYHIGMLILNDFKDPVCSVLNKKERNITQKNVQNNEDNPITFKISDKINTINKIHNQISAIENQNKWQYLNNINKNNNEYAHFENNIDIDKECTSHKIDVPKIVLKYEDIDIDDLDEIVDIKFKIDMESNKKNFENDININLYKNGDKYIPKNEIAREIVYPSTITNVNQEFITTFDIEQENMTICSRCLKTSLGYNDTCQYCGSTHVVHSDIKKSATVCYNCGWIIDGWNEYCTHCLSRDVEKIQIDYNKTYCNDCKTLSPDYYKNCPHCLSSDVTHLTNNTNRYTIFGENKQSIEPITICTETEDTYIDVFSLYIPFNKYTSELSKLQYLTLQVHGTNNNDGKYYYCDACGSADIGNYDTCPYCGSSLIINNQISKYILRPFYSSGNISMMYEDMISPSQSVTCKTNKTYNTNIPIGNFTKEIDLIKCACHNDMDKFKLTFRIENQSYNEINEAISELPIKDEYKVDILSDLLLYNISIDNLSLDYKYKNENEWVGLDKLEGANHTGIKYKISNKSKTADKIKFTDFNIDKNKYKHAYLYISGLLKDINDATMNIEINNGGKISRKSVNIVDNLFTYEYNILERTDMNIDDLSVKVYFTDIGGKGEVIITDCHILLESKKYKNGIHDNINDISSELVSHHNHYLFKSLNNNIWGINDIQPYYLSGRQLETGLIGYIDFGKLDLEEYIRIYDINMIISYKTKNSHMISETIFSPDNNESLKAILKGAGYNTNTPKKIVQSKADLKTVLQKKNIQIEDSDIEQLLHGDIISQNSILWGSIYYEEDTLNNLESEITNINEDDELVNDIPLYYQIAQAFNTGDYLTSIGSIQLSYFKKRGYPSDLINIYICKDHDGKPGTIIGSNKIQIQNNDINKDLNIDLSIDNLHTNTQYWLVIEDISANSNNYHRFRYNNNPEQNSLIGECLTYQNEHYTHQDCVLSFSISKMKRDKTFSQLPTRWIFDENSSDGYKIHYILYRYNIEDGNNISLSNFLIKSGYNIWRT